LFLSLTITAVISDDKAYKQVMSISFGDCVPVVEEDENEKKFLTVVYFVVPLFVLTMFLPVLLNEQRGLMMRNQTVVVLYPRVVQKTMGLMTPNPWPDAVATDYDAVQYTLNNIPDAYLKDDTAIGSTATISKLKSFLDGTDRMHIAAHGRWDGTAIVVLDSDLTQSVVNLWSQQGQRCKLTFLSSCNSMGHDGAQNNVLASAIMAKSGVSQVIGYKNYVDAGAAAAFAGCFWTHHLWANGENGGVSSDTAFYDTKDELHRITENAWLMAMIAAVLTGAVIAVIAGVISGLWPEIPWAYWMLVAILVSLYSFLIFGSFVGAIDSAYYNVAKYGADVPGLTYSSSGGGRGDLPQ